MIGKKTIVSEIAKKIKNLNLKREAKVEEIVDFLFETLEHSLISGERIVFQNLFSLNIINRGERKGKNPRTGKEIIIPKCKSISLKISPNLKEKINESK